MNIYCYIYFVPPPGRPRLPAFPLLRPGPTGVPQRLCAAAEGGQRDDTAVLQGDAAAAATGELENY